MLAFKSHEVFHLPLPQRKDLFETNGAGVLCSPAKLCLARLAPFSQKEAVTRLLLHVIDAVLKGRKKLIIRTVDTDVMVLAVASFKKIAPDQAFGT